GRGSGNRWHLGGSHRGDRGGRNRGRGYDRRRIGISRMGWIRLAWGPRGLIHDCASAWGLTARVTVCRGYGSPLIIARSHAGSNAGSAPLGQPQAHEEVVQGSTATRHFRKRARFVGLLELSLEALDLAAVKVEVSFA